MSRKSTRLSMKATNNEPTVRSSRTSKNKYYFESSSDEEVLESKTDEKKTNRTKKEKPEQITSPRKHKNVDVIGEPSTPPKQKRIEKSVENQVECDENKVKSPSSILSKLTLASPNKNSRKSLFSNDIYVTAKKALHSTVPKSMPGRQKENEELELFIEHHLENKISGSLYISGPPGTGKTASLTLILERENIIQSFQKVYVNCTSIKSPGAVFSRIIKELGLKSGAKNEKEYLNVIESYFSKPKKMILLVLDEMDQLECKNQSVLYTIFEWPAKFKQSLILVGIANALDLTDRILPRLQIKCELKPKLLHFSPYSKQQIIEIIKSRLEETDSVEIFSPAALQMLSGKVAAVSGDVRRALDIARRVLDQIKDQNVVLNSIENVYQDNSKKVDLKDVASVLSKVYGTTQNLSEDCDSGFPIQQKIVICSLLLILQKSKNKDVTVGRLHDVYKKVCTKQNLFSVDQSEFLSLCSLIETKGILKISGKKEPRLFKVNLEWDQEEVMDVLKDKTLISRILQDNSIVKV